MFFEDEKAHIEMTARHLGSKEFGEQFEDFYKGYSEASANRPQSEGSSHGRNRKYSYDP